jgi:PST family polysaccharide transporter
VPIVRFGSNIVGIRFIHSFVSSGPNIMIGWFWGANLVGLYQKAYGLLMFAVDQIHAPVSAVALSPLSRVQSDPLRFRRFFLACYSIVVSGALPVVIVSAVFAGPIIRLLLGEQWLSAVPIFRWLSYGAVFVTLLNPLGIAQLAVGRADWQVRITIVDSAIVILAYAVALPFGIEAMAIAFLVVRAIVWVPITVAMLKGTGVGLSQLLGTLRAPAVAGFGAAVAGHVVQILLPVSLNAFFTTSIGTAVMFSVYGAILLFGLGQWNFYRDILREIVRGRRLRFA